MLSKESFSGVGTSVPGAEQEVTAGPEVRSRCVSPLHLCVRLLPREVLPVFLYQETPRSFLLWGRGKFLAAWLWVFFLNIFNLLCGSSIATSLFSQVVPTSNSSGFIWVDSAPFWFCFSPVCGLPRLLPTPLTVFRLVLSCSYLFSQWLWVFALGGKKKKKPTHFH